LPDVSTSQVTPGKPAGNISATGGTVYEQRLGNVTYRFHTYESSFEFRVFAGAGFVEYLMVGGGGGGGSSNYRGGGGGGAGGVLLGKAYVEFDDTPGGTVYTVVVGAAGAGGTATGDGSNGGDTELFGKTAFGGGGGARNRNARRAGLAGASAGMSIGTDGNLDTVGTHIPGQGSPGMRTTTPSNNNYQRQSETGGAYVPVWQTPNNGRDRWSEAASAIPYGTGFISDFDGTPRHYGLGGLQGLRSVFNGDPSRHFGQGGMGGQGGLDTSTTERDGADGGGGYVVIRYPIAFTPMYGQG
jgi:hypothetical protein